jgi:phosphoglycolate phosphatase-like HAD superfamily hydrolase
LEDLILERYPAGTFQGVYGGYGCKLRNLKAISLHAAVTPGEIAMVGDGIDDANAAEAFGCAFLGVAGGGLANRTGSIRLTENLIDIAAFLGLGQNGVINHE